MKISAIVVAAGSGSRFGFKKQFAKLKSKPVMDYSIDVLKNICDEIVIVVQKSDLEYVKKRFDFAIVVEGGKERANSVYNGLLKASCDIVIVHDAARPLINENFVESIIKKVKECGSAIPVLAVSETLKRVEKGMVIGTVDRSSFYLAQTPQAFDYEKLKSAYDKAIASGKNYTDEASVWEEFYGFVCCVDGIKRNIKITFKEDLEFAECLLG